MIMSMNTRAEILQMVADGVITQEEADRLMRLAHLGRGRAIHRQMGSWKRLKTGRKTGFAQKRRSHAKTSAWRWMWEGLNCCPHGMESCGPK